LVNVVLSHFFSAVTSVGRLHCFPFVFFGLVLNCCLCGSPLSGWFPSLCFLSLLRAQGAEYSHPVLLFRLSSPPDGILCVIQLFLRHPVSMHSTSLAWSLPFVGRVPVADRSFACRQFSLVFFLPSLSALVILKFQFFFHVLVCECCRVKPEYYLSRWIKGLEVS
jgi:hypothetical protein